MKRKTKQSDTTRMSLAREHENFLSAHRDNIRGAEILMKLQSQLKESLTRIAELEGPAAWASTDPVSGSSRVIAGWQAEVRVRGETIAAQAKRIEELESWCTRIAKASLDFKKRAEDLKKELDGERTVVGVKTAKVEGKKIKADTWYCLRWH